MDSVGSFVVDELLAAVKDVVKKNIHFKDCCQKLQVTLEGLIPTLEAVAYNQLQDDPQTLLKEFYEKLQIGKALVQKCSKVSQLNIWRINKYASKIERLDQDILKFIEAITKFYICHVYFKKSIASQRIIKDCMDLLENIPIASPSSIPKLPDCSDGLEITVGELKKPLLSEDVQVLGELEMASSSNTALLTAVRNDKEFQGMMRQNPGLQFDVFINHRGVDVKNTLASFIYHQLKTKDPNLRVFLDKKEIPCGVDFSYAIETAIQSSSVHIAIFSERYAESKWCLRELDLIINSKGKVIPVFCDIDPAALRRIDKGCYKEAFEKHRKRESLEETKRWEDALARASDLQGLSLKMNEEDMGDFAVKIAGIVSMNLKESHFREIFWKFFRWVFQVKIWQQFIGITSLIVAAIYWNHKFDS